MATGARYMQRAATIARAVAPQRRSPSIKALAAFGALRPLCTSASPAVVEEGMKVAVHYTGKLQSGEVFDSSDGRDPLEFEVGAGQMIMGFDAAVHGMAVGEKKTVSTTRSVIPLVNARVAGDLACGDGLWRASR